MPKIKDPNIQAVLDYERFFGKPVPADPIAKLEKYPTDVLIVLLAKINAIIFHSGHDGNKAEVDVFRHVFNRLGHGVHEHIRAIRSRDIASRGAIFTSPPIVGLMAKLIARYRPLKDEDNINEQGMQILMLELFETILAFNGNYYSSDADNMLSKEHLWKLELMQQDFARGITNMYGVIPIKVFLFFRFISERYGEDVLQEFAKSFGVASAYNFYFVFLQTVANSFSEYEADGQPRFVIVDETLEKVFLPFVFDPLKRLETPFSGESFVLMNQPFFPLDEGVAVLDFSFFSHLTDVSLLYHFYQSTSLKGSHGIKNYNEYLGMIGKHFVEEYLTVQLLRKAFHHRHDKLFTEKDDPQNPDVLIIQNNKDVFVIEVKSSRVHGKVLGESDVTGFQTFLEESFAKEKTGVGEKKKGIQQLKMQIQSLKTRGAGYRIFPIIIYTESSLDIAGVNSFLDQKFEAIIEEERMFFTTIHPLTLINLHFFIKYFPQLKKDRYFMRDKIKEYHKRKKRQLKEASKKNNPFIYFLAEYSFMRMMEQTYPAGDPINYFKFVAADFGFKEEPIPSQSL